jgi:hypothetical protein
VLQAMANMAVNVNLFPVTGVTLPTCVDGWLKLPVYLFLHRDYPQRGAQRRAARRPEKRAERRARQQDWKPKKKTKIIEEEQDEESYEQERIIIAGGGTGGHIFPALAIANALKGPSTRPIDILFVGARGKMEMEKVPQAGFPIKGLDIAGFNRSSLIKNVALPFKLIKSFFQVRSIC